PIARQEAVKRVFGRAVADVHALDAAMLAIWWLTGSQMAAGAPDLGALKVWDSFTIADQFGEETYQIVPPNTADPSNGMVSWASPLVQALVGKQVGDQVTVQSPGGDWLCRLVTISEYE
ncbi:MAG TPA: GreA/GreB family elongation factor, partial [Symbiobacteriaceae bacterium]|nr:GreA/GreB family elongation factor [Symbiobacteriaceae bacterium]